VSIQIRKAQVSDADNVANLVLALLSELYVVPQFRSEGAGQELIREAVRFGHERNWGRLEVGAPDVPRWNRTVSFYRKNGFTEVGPRLKLLL
jgi:GNAT superfamily N-acetyltransferase